MPEPTNNPGFQPRREAPQRLHPKKVRGGVKLSEGPGGTPVWSANWAAQRWVRLVEQAVPGPAMVEGLQYARQGQTKSITIERGGVVAVIQGRADRPYTVRLTLAPFGEEQWAAIVQAMSDQAVYAAKLLAGELPSNIEDLFVPLGLKLFPTEPTEVVTECSCVRVASGGSRWGASSGSGPGSGPIASPMWAATPTPPVTQPATTPSPEPASDRVASQGWCKHACCAGLLLAERLAADSFLMFKIRGVAGGELIDRLRHARSASVSVRGSSGAYVGRVPGVSDVEAVELDAVLDRFWDAGPEVDKLEWRVVAPDVSHPLLRRLGPSPFPNSTFPLVGLLASCYETISGEVIRTAGEAPVDDPDDEDLDNAEEGIGGTDDEGE